MSARLGWIGLWIALLLAPGARAEEIAVRSGPIHVARIAGSINPASADYLKTAINEAGNASVLILELDTPGGLVASTKDIIQVMLGSPVPIVVFVSPQGAWAGSAGVFITMAANVAAMTPGSSIGAAHPVGIGGASPPPVQGEDGEQRPSDYAAQKAENLLTSFIESIAAKRGRNVEWAAKAVRESVAATAEEALELGVIDLVVANRSELVAALDGREIELDSGTVRLDLAGATTVDVEMSLVTRVLNVIADPNVAVLLLMAGLLLLYIELNNPGLIIPGVTGAICLALALIAMQILPFSWFGALLFIVGIGLMVAEAFFTSFGLLFVAGTACMLLGGSMLFDRPEVSDLNISFWPVLVPSVLGFAICGAIVVWGVSRSLGRAQTAGVSELQGMRGTASTALDPEGTVFLRGEYWTAVADEEISKGEPVVAVSVEGLRLHVQKPRAGNASAD